MRDWDRSADALAAAGARLIVVSADAEPVLRRSVQTKSLPGAFAAVDPALWTAWGVVNPKRPKLPHPGTVVVAPDGTVVFLELHVDYKRRTPPAAVIEGIEAHQAGGATAAPAGLPEAPSLDWGSALEVSAARAPGRVELTLTVAEGFHVYGTREANARPLAARVDGGAFVLPEGRRKELGDGLGEAWVVSGEFTVTAQLPGDGPAKGELDVQLCTDSACSPPRTLQWATP